MDKSPVEKCPQDKCPVDKCPTTRIAGDADGVPAAGPVRQQPGHLEAPRGGEEAGEGHGGTGKERKGGAGQQGQGGPGQQEGVGREVGQCQPSGTPTWEPNLFHTDNTKKKLCRYVVFTFRSTHMIACPKFGHPALSLEF